MKDGSYQVECSDEGLITDDIQDCLKLVIRRVKAEGGTSASKWALEMLLADRVGFICEKPLKRLSGQHGLPSPPTRSDSTGATGRRTFGVGFVRSCDIQFRL